MGKEDFGKEDFGKEDFGKEDFGKEDLGMTVQNAVTRFAARTSACARGALHRIWRVVDRDAVLLTLNGASIPVAWIALWFVLAGLLTTE
jgi:hypothetical protein